MKKIRVKLGKNQMICGSKGFVDGIDDILAFMTKSIPTSQTVPATTPNQPNRKEEELCLQELVISTDCSGP
jgi:hypothetical protein